MEREKKFMDQEVWANTDDMLMQNLLVLTISL